MLMIMFIQGAYVHMVFIYIPSNVYSSAHVLRVLLRGIDNVYVLKVLRCTNNVYSSAYVLMVFLLLTLLTNSAYVTDSAYSSAYVLMLLKEGAFIVDNTY
jgi:hypothetical protein